MFRPLHLTPYIKLNRPFLTSNYPPHPRLFTLSALSLANKALPPRLKIQDADVTISYLKGTGPGGQKIVCNPALLPSDCPALILISYLMRRTKPTRPSSSYTNPPVWWSSLKPHDLDPRMRRLPVSFSPIRWNSSFMETKVVLPSGPIAQGKRRPVR